MDVKLISITPDFLKKIWVAARTCYSSLSPIELMEMEPDEDEMLRIANKIIKSRHLSVLEHCSMTYAVKNVSRTLLAQYSRHRIGISLSVQSQRYVSEESAKREDGVFDFVMPGDIEKNEEARKIFLEAMKKCQHYYDKFKELGIKNEDARFVLPGGAATNFVTTLNLRSFFDIYEKRVLTRGAQWEIRQLLLKMRELLLEKEPWLNEYLVEG